MTLSTTRIVPAAAALLAVGALAASAAPAAPDFKVTVAGAGQTVDRGQTAVYTIALKRTRGFARTIKLSTAALPAGATATWRLAGGAARTGAVSVPRTVRSVQLSIATAAATPTSGFTPKIVATSGSLKRTARVSLQVRAGATARPDFAMTATPANAQLVQGDVATFTVRLSRVANYQGPVALSAAGLPQGATAAFSPATLSAPADTATLTVQTGSDTPAGSYALTIAGNGGQGAAHAAGLTLNVAASEHFSIAGDLGTALIPGRSAPLDLTLTNPNHFDLRITSLDVTLNDTGLAGCSAAENFRVAQPTAAYPLVLRPGSSKLSEMGATTAQLPRVEMLNLATNQDACRNATLTLHYTGTATR